jgi:hypothetical protein
MTVRENVHQLVDAAFRYWFRADLIVEDRVIVETQSVEELAPVH